MNFFFDIDGTILPFGKSAPRSAVEAIHALRADGHRAFLATGRSPVEVNQSVYDIGFDGGVFSAGAAIIADNKCIYQKMMSRSERDFLLSYCEKRGFRVLVQTMKGTFVSQSDFDFWRSAMIEHTGAAVSLSSIVIAPSVPEDIPVIKLLYVAENAPLESVRKDLEDEFDVVDNTVGLPSWMMGEIVMKGISKATGIDKILKYYGDPLSSSAAFGDGANDIEMVEYAEYGISMGNASDELKAVADWIAPSVEEDGLSCGISHVLKISTEQSSCVR